MHAMVETSVLIYAVNRKPTADARLQYMRRASAALLEDLPRIRVAAIAWFEAMWAASPSERAELEKLASKIYIDQFDDTASSIAVDIIRKQRSRGKMCERCWNLDGAQECKRCKRLVAKQLRMNDIFIVATAEAQPDVTELYSFDGGFLDLGKTTRCTILEPPNPDGPLFVRTEPAEEPAAATVVPIKPVK